MIRSSRRLPIVALTAAFIMLSQSALAQRGQELEGRIGLGMSKIGPGQKPAISVDWQATQATSFEFNIAIDTSENNNFLEAGAIVSRNLFIEENLSYFLYLGGAAISKQVNGVNQNGYGIDAGVGVLMPRLW